MGNCKIHSDLGCQNQIAAHYGGSIGFTPSFTLCKSDNIESRDLIIICVPRQEQCDVITDCKLYNNERALCGVKYGEYFTTH